MNTAKKVIRSDEQGMVHVDVPVGSPGEKIEVLVVWQVVGEGQPESSQEGGAEATNDEPDEAFMAQFVGVLQPGDLERPPQGEPERRRSFE